MAIIPTSGEFTKVPDGGGSDNRFVVTLTPTAEDYSGTMDKTVGEIREAWLAGKSIYFYMDGFGYFPLAVATNYFITYGINVPQNAFMVLTTDDISDNRTYITKIYQLTPMGS